MPSKAEEVLEALLPPRRKIPRLMFLNIGDRVAWDDGSTGTVCRTWFVRNGEFSIIWDNDVVTTHSYDDDKIPLTYEEREDGREGF